MLRLRPVAPLPKHAAGPGESAHTARISDRRLQKYVAHDERVTERKIHVESFGYLSRDSFE